MFVLFGSMFVFMLRVCVCVAGGGHGETSLQVTDTILKLDNGRLTSTSFCRLQRDREQPTFISA